MPYQCGPSNIGHQGTKDLFLWQPDECHGNSHVAVRSSAWNGESKFWRCRIWIDESIRLMVKSDKLNCIHTTKYRAPLENIKWFFLKQEPCFQLSVFKVMLFDTLLHHSTLKSIPQINFLWRKIFKAGIIEVFATVFWESMHFQCETKTHAFCRYQTIVKSTCTNKCAKNGYFC